MIILISILFINQWYFITEKIKNTYLFNSFLYYFLIFKNGLYVIIFEYFDYVEHEKYQKLIIFLTGFVLSSWSLNIFFLILNNSYNLSILLFFLLLILNIFNLIEKKLIFTSENLNIKNLNIDYNSIKSLLKINNKKFNKNQSLFYIQKRYMHFNEIKSLIKRHGVTVITSATAGSLFTGYLQHSGVQIQKEELGVQRESLQVQIKQFEFKKEMEIKKKHSDQLKMREELLSNYDDKIGVLNKKIHKIKIDMDTHLFWKKADFYESIEELKKERDLLKRRRVSFEEEIKGNFEINPNKKIKIDNNSLLDD
jgi:hypothetical protein